MTRVTIYPNLLLNPETRPNPYISDLITALSFQKEIEIANRSSKNPLLSILNIKAQGDVFIFNWLEDVIFQKYGILQFLAAIYLILSIKLRGKQFIWMLHNKSSHTKKYSLATKCLRILLARFSSTIITHAKEGIELIKSEYPYATQKSLYIEHPTKNRLFLNNSKPYEEREFDVLIWGTISRYKGVTEFVQFIKEQKRDSLKVCIIGRCSSSELQRELLEAKTINTTIINESPSFEDLADYVNNSRFVLVPYHSESILSSGVLMDSLSFGAKVIGPNVGSFADYSHSTEVNVYTFEHFDEIPSIITRYSNQSISIEKYHSFLEKYSWPLYANQIAKLFNRNK